LGEQGTGLVLDVRDHAAVDALIADIEQRFGCVAVLVNNAGITRDNLLLRMKTDDWQDILDVHLTAVFLLSKRVLKGMAKARFGRIINITSVVARMGNAGQANYAAAKAGIEGFSRALAREMGSRNITVNCVAPGFIDTDMTEVLDEKVKQTMLDAVPLGRLGQPDDVAAAVAFLAGSGGAYITGTVLPVNGGMYLD
jgi:3-oxoacyl-[acyl-carrier protein] reductase